VGRQRKRTRKRRGRRADRKQRHDWRRGRCRISAQATTPGRRRWRGHRANPQTNGELGCKAGSQMRNGP
jgi:hypothetical protein